MSDSPTVQPQQAFDELARITLADHTLSSVMDKVAELARQTVPGAVSVSVTVVERGRASTAAASGEMAVRLDERQYQRGHGPCLDAVEGNQPVHVPDTRSEDRYPEFAEDAQQHGAGSSLSLPIPVQREVAAALNIYGTDPHAFDEHAQELASTFAAYAGVALANMHLYEAQGRVAEQLQNAMASRAVIEQAKGILMGGRGCDAGEAFSILVSLSQNTNRKLRDVAQALVDEAASRGRQA